MTESQNDPGYSGSEYEPVHSYTENDDEGQ